MYLATLRPCGELARYERSAGVLKGVLQQSSAPFVPHCLHSPQQISCWVSAKAALSGQMTHTPDAEVNGVGHLTVRRAPQRHKQAVLP